MFQVAFVALNRLGLLQRLHIHYFHEEVGKGGIAWFVAHAGPALLPAAQSVLDVELGLGGGDFTALAVYGGTQIHFINAVVYAVAADELDAVAVEILRSLYFGEFALAHFIA